MTLTKATIDDVTTVAADLVVHRHLGGQRRCPWYRGNGHPRGDRLKRTTDCPTLLTTEVLVKPSMSRQKCLDLGQGRH